MKRHMPYGLLLLLSAGFLRADVHPNTANGFPANGAFNSGPVDSINLFNGGLSLAVPIGNAYPVNSDFGYQLKLVYGSNPWMYQTVTHLVPPDSHEVTRTAAFPNPCSNAGLGWRVSLGRMDPPCQVPDAGGSQPGPIYQDESGTDHVFYPTLHTGDPEDAPIVGISDIQYTRDGSYLRLKVYASGIRDVEFPNGMVKKFDAFGQLFQMRDPFNNNLSISYATPGQWVLTDSQGRTHRIYFRSDLPSYGETVDRIELANFTALPAVYQFSYATALIGRSCPHNDNFEADGIGPNVNVPLLTGVTLPDGSQWKTTAGDYVTAFATACTEGGGNITSWTLPTLGRMEWTYQTYYFPTGSSNRKHLQRNPGIATRAMRNPDGTLLGAWSYTTPSLGTVLSSKDLVNSVIDPLGNKKVSYFSTALDIAFTGWSRYEYSLPFTRNSTLNVAPGLDLGLSSQIFSASGTLLRSEYVLYERDVVSGSLPPEIYNSNRRLLRSRTVYHDDGGLVAGVVNQEFDGLGHYRLAQTEGSFPAGSNVRTRYDHYNPARGTYSINAAANTPNPGFNVLPSTSAWALETMDFNWDAENGATAFRATCYAPGSSKLVRLRTYRLDAATQGTQDLVSVFDLSAAGNVVAEKHYGGDAQGGIPNATSDNCTMPLPATPEYASDHTYAGGVRATSKYAGTAFYILDRTIDVNSGQVVSERDASGIGTSYEYDSMGRTTWAKPDVGHGSWTQFLYNAANPATLANAYVFRRHRDNGSKAASILTTSQTMVDPFGRLSQEQRRLPDGNLNKRETTYDNAGNRASVSEWMTGAATKKTQYLSYDAFGRPATIRPPDGPAHDVTLSYLGGRQVSRTVKIATAASGTEGAATTTEVYDRLGRLIQVAEPSGAAGADVTTSYAYDVGSRLVGVSTPAAVSGSGNVTQTRSFSYDRAGLLQSETHPEKGAGGNGSVTYPRYDSRGNLLRVVDGANDLTYLYDAAERLYLVRESGGAQRTFKSFSYASNNASFTDPVTGLTCTDYRKGRVTQQARFNYVAVSGSPFTVELREAMTYCGRGGAESRRTLENYVNGATTPSEAFVVPNIAYNSFGDLSALGYPQCMHAGCAAASPRTVTFGYSDGLLSSVGVPGNASYYASSISYHPNLMIHQVAHTNAPADPAKNLTDTFANDPSAIRRPASITVTTPANVVRWSTGTYAYDGAGDVKAIGPETFAYDKVGRLVASNQYLEPTTPTTLRSQIFSYEAFGNLLTIGGNGGRATPTAPSTNRLTGGSYDAAGNLTAWNGNVYEYGPFNRLWHYKTAGDEWIYLYTADDERAWSYKVGNSSLWVLREPGSGLVLREYQNSSGSWSVAGDYIYRDGTLLAAETPAGVRHVHVDHLGTPRLISDALGTQAAFHVYFPYGDEATVFNQDTLRAKFTGHERDLGNPSGPSDDLDNMHARFYNPQTGRFLSVDPLGADPRAPQTWNRFAYVKANPLRYTDPRGLCASVPGYEHIHIDGCITVTASNTANSLVAGRLSLSFLLDQANGFNKEFGGRAFSFFPPGTDLERLARGGDELAMMELGLPVQGAAPDDLGWDIAMFLVPGPFDEAAFQGFKLTGYTKHGINQAISRDGVGVASKALLDAVKNPVKVIFQKGGAVKLVGRHAVVVLNKQGKVITTWATTAAARRIR